MLLVALANTVAADSDCGLQPASTLTGASCCPWVARGKCHCVGGGACCPETLRIFEDVFPFFLKLNQPNQLHETSNFFFLTRQNPLQMNLQIFPEIPSISTKISLTKPSCLSIFSQPCTAEANSNKKCACIGLRRVKSFFLSTSSL